MCLSCGCGKPNDAHGDDRHITRDDLDRAAQAANISPEKAAQNIVAGFGQSQTGGMQTQPASQPSTPA